MSLLERTLLMGRRSISSSEDAAINVGGRSRVARRAEREKETEREREREAEKGRRGKEEAHTRGGGGERGRGEEGKGTGREGEKRGKRKKRRRVEEREQRREKGEGRERKSVKDLWTGAELGLSLAGAQGSPNSPCSHRTNGSVFPTDTPPLPEAPGSQLLAPIGQCEREDSKAKMPSQHCALSRQRHLLCSSSAH